MSTLAAAATGTPAQPRRGILLGVRVKSCLGQVAGLQARRYSDIRS